MTDTDERQGNEAEAGEKAGTTRGVDSAESPGGDGALWPGWSQFWDSKAGLSAAVAVTVVVSGLLYFGNLGELGIWEPWEAGDVLVAREYQDRPEPEPLSERDPEAPSYNWAVPTRDGEPVHRSFLKTWLVSQTLVAPDDESGEMPVGELEFSARAPMAIALLLISVLGLFWLRRIYGTWPALLGTLAFVSTPAIFFGVHNVSSEMLFVATTTAAIMAFVALMYAEGPIRYLWGLLFGAALGLAFLDQRYLGLLVPMATIAGFGVTQLPYLRAARSQDEARGEETYLGWPQIAGAVGAIVAAGITLWWGYSGGGGAAAAQADQGVAPHVKQLMALLVPAWIVVAGLALAWKTRVVSRLFSLPGLFGLGVAAGIIVPFLEAYADANPTLLMDGEVVGKIPVATYALENTFYGTGLLNEHLHFAMWIRELGFSTFPWVALAPLGVGYLARATRLTDRNGGLREDVLSRGESVKRLFLVWTFLSFVLVAAAGVYDHFFYPAYFPLIAAAGLMLADSEFWQSVRVRTLLPYVMGVMAIGVMIMVSKDLEQWPGRFVEFFAMLQQDVGLPDEFTYGSLLDRLKYVFMLAFVVFFFGVVSWVILTFRWARANIWPAIRRVYAIVAVGLAGLAFDAYVLDENVVMGRIYGGVLGVLVLYGAISLYRRRAEIAEWFRRWDETESGETLARERAVAKDRLRRESTPGGVLSRFFESSETGGALITVLFVGVAGVFLFKFAPQLGHHLSQRSVFETYSDLRQQGEELKRYQVSTSDSSVYLRNVASIPNRRALLDTFDQSERVFMVVRRESLSTLNKHVRERFDRHVPVLDARSSQLVLISNKLGDDEDNQNFIADAVVEDTSEIQHDVTFKDKNGEQVRATFDNRLELLGYTLDRPGEVPTYEWGEKAKLSIYFRVKRPVPASYQIFLHVDYGSNRIHGDHYPMGGDFPTTDWMRGDVVKDVYELEIDKYTSTGVYEMNFGFYRGSNRMKVQPRSAHDGGNRVTLGRIRVAGF